MKTGGGSPEVFECWGLLHVSLNKEAVSCGLCLFLCVCVCVCVCWE
jgi:hypothetical protein